MAGRMQQHQAQTETKLSTAAAAPQLFSYHTYYCYTVRVRGLASREHEKSCIGNLVLAIEEHSIHTYHRFVWLCGMWMLLCSCVCFFIWFACRRHAGFVRVFWELTIFSGTQQMMHVSVAAVARCVSGYLNMKHGRRFHRRRIWRDHFSSGKLKYMRTRHAVLSIFCKCTYGLVHR